MKIAIFDIDATIADDRWRRRKVNWQATDPDERYGPYHEHSVMDEPMNLELIANNIEAGYQIMFMTSRPARYRNQTVTWLRNNTPDYHKFPIIMRPEDDHRHSPELKVMLLRLMLDTGFVDLFGEEAAAVEVVVYDDRKDVLDAIDAHWPFAWMATVHVDTGPSMIEANGRALEPAEILREMANTFERRSSEYKDNMHRVMPVLEALFPDGVPPASTKMHVLNIMIMKLTRFAVSDMNHIDSIHDLGAYCAIMESLIRKENRP